MKKKSTKQEIRQSLIYRNVNLMVMSWLTDSYKTRMDKAIAEMIMDNQLVQKVIKIGYSHEKKINSTIGSLDVNNIKKMDKQTKIREKNSFYIVKHNKKIIWINDLGNKKLTYPRYSQAMINFAEILFKEFPEGSGIVHQSKMKKAITKREYYDIFERFQKIKRDEEQN